MRQKFIERFKDGQYSDELLGWPVWTATCFIAAMVFIGLLTGVAMMVNKENVSAQSTLGLLTLEILSYIALLAGLLSIKYIRFELAVRQRKLAMIVLAALFVVLTLIYTHSLIGPAFYFLAAFIIGALFTLLTIPAPRRIVNKKILGIERLVSWSDIGLGVAGFIIFFIIVAAVNVTLLQLVPSYDISQKQDLGFTTLFGFERTLAFFALVVVAPIVEELIMRGFLFGKLRAARMAFWPAAIIVSVLFGIAHGQWNVGVMTFVLSMVACYLRESTGAIWSGVIIHMIVNGMAFVQLFMK